MERLSIIKAENAGNLCVNLTFSDNTIQTIDVGDFIRRHPHPQYNKYLDPRKFNRFTLENGNVVWGKNWDLIFPIEQLHAGILAQYHFSSRLRRSVGGCYLIINLQISVSVRTYF